MGTKLGIVLDEPDIWVSIPLEGPYWHDIFHLFPSSWPESNVYHPHGRWFIFSLPAKSPTCKVDYWINWKWRFHLMIICWSPEGCFSWGDWDFYLWWIRLAVKFTVSGSTDLVSDIATYSKRGIILNNLGLLPNLLYIYWTCLLNISLEVRRFTYYWIIWDCEVRYCSSMLGKSSVSSYRSTLVGYWTILEWIAW